MNNVNEKLINALIDLHNNSQIFVDVLTEENAKHFNLDKYKVGHEVLFVVDDCLVFKFPNSNHIIRLLDEAEKRNTRHLIAINKRNFSVVSITDELYQENLMNEKDVFHSKVQEILSYAAEQAIEKDAADYYIRQLQKLKFEVK